MGVYVKGMEMPTSCRKCMISQPDGCGWICPIIESKPVVDGRVKSRHPHCPLVPVPPHDGEAFEKVISERISQTDKWGNNPCNHPFEWMSILGEEYGELCEAVNETCFMNGKHPERGGAENIVREAAQIAAVAIAIIRDYSHTSIPAEPEEEKMK